MRRFLVCVVLLVACKGSKSQGTSPGSGTAAAASGSAPVAVVAADAPMAGSGDGSGSAPTEVKRSKEVAELEATLVGLTGEAESDARSKKTCGQLMEIHKKVHAVALAKPAGVDTAAWDAAIAKMASDITDGLAVTCKDDPPDDSVELPKLYKDFQALLALLPK